MDIDYLILGSGLSALTFGALMAKAGKTVQIIEAHEFPGGFGHTFIEKNKTNEYHFNAQFHYVWDCGVGGPVYQILKKLGLESEVTFQKYGTDGFDHMRIPNYALNVPSDWHLLEERMAALFPKDMQNIKRFFAVVKRVAQAMRYLRKPCGVSLIKHLSRNIASVEVLKYYRCSLQNVFDQFALPKPAQTLLASQWLDFLLPPEQLSFYAWATLFCGYVEGAYYPTHHFEHVIYSLVKIIEEHKGRMIYNEEVIGIVADKNKIVSVKTRETNQPHVQHEYTAKQIICNIDPQLAANMIGLSHFSKKVRKQLSYDYSYSNFVVYGAVEGIDLRDYGFGNWNLFHSESTDLNLAFAKMYHKMDYQDISFGMATPSMATHSAAGCPEGQQIFELLTVANYGLFKNLKLRDGRAYNKAKIALFDRMLDIIERDYVPHFRKHISFKMLGAPTTNESYCYAPFGNSYGMNLTPENMGIAKLSAYSSIKNLHFCNASSGSPSFAKAFNNGAALYEDLTHDPVFVN